MQQGFLKGLCRACRLLSTLVSPLCMTPATFNSLVIMRVALSTTAASQTVFGLSETRAAQSCFGLANCSQQGASQTDDNSLSSAPPFRLQVWGPPLVPGLGFCQCSRAQPGWSPGPEYAGAAEAAARAGLPCSRLLGRAPGKPPIVAAGSLCHPLGFHTQHLSLLTECQHDWWPRSMSAQAFVQPHLHSPTSSQYAEQCLWCRSHISRNSMTPLPTALQAARQQVQLGSHASGLGGFAGRCRALTRGKVCTKAAPCRQPCVPPSCRTAPILQLECTSTQPTNPSTPSLYRTQQAAMSGAHSVHFRNLPRRLVAEMRALRWTPCSKQLTCRLLTRMVP